MSTLIDRTTPDDELKLLYYDNAGYSTANDPDMAARFVEVCRVLLFRALTAVDVDGAQVQMRPEVLERQIKLAEQFAARGRAKSNVVFSHFGGFRT